MKKPLKAGDRKFPSSEGLGVGANPQQPTTKNPQLKGKSILITGGTGSFGRALVERLLRDFQGIEKLLVFSRDELKQFEMRQEFPADQYPALRFMLGDVRDAG